MPYSRSSYDPNDNVANEVFKRFFNHLDNLAAHIFWILRFFFLLAALRTSAEPLTITGFGKIFFYTLGYDLLVYPLLLFGLRWIFCYDPYCWYPMSFFRFLEEFPKDQARIWWEIIQLHREKTRWVELRWAGQVELVDEQWLNRHYLL